MEQLAKRDASESEQHRSKWRDLLNRLANLATSGREQEEAAENANELQARVSDHGPPTEAEEAAKWLRGVVKEAAEKDEEARSELFDTSLGGAPLILGPQEYRDCSIWSADWRKGLSEDDPERPTDPDDFATWDDDQTLATLATLSDLEVPRRPVSK